MGYLDELNEPQREAVLNTEGPCMIMAGAGSGKTKVLTYRITHLMKDKGIEPYNILSLTFTNKAAKEMRNRIEKMVGTEARSLWMGTFHSVFSRILRVEAEKIGFPNNFTIYDTDDSRSLIRQIVKEMNLDDKLYKANTVHNRISAAKNRLVGVQDYINNPHFAADDNEAGRPEMGNIFKKYQERLFKAGAMDFDDLLFNTNLLFKNHVDVLNKYQNMFKYVMVDEYQDTNFSQYLITKKLAARHQNICVVGDDAQSIYAFRGADIQNILNFEKDYPDMKVFKLEQNYRSTKTIVSAANSIIAKNTAQLPKNVWTANDDGNLVNVIRANSDNEEGKLVASNIFESKMQQHLRNSDFAILYRTNSQSRSMEEALRRLNIPYKIYGGTSFYQRKEIKDLLAYLRYTLNPADEESLKRIINYPKRGIGDTSVQKLLVFAEDQGITLWDVLSNINQLMRGAGANAIETFVTMIRSFQVTAKNKDAFDAATEIAKQSGILKELYEDKTPEGVSRYENVQELLNGIKEYVDDETKEDKSLGAFLQEISLLTDADQEKDDDRDKVSLMTIHASKGLEFKYVYVSGLEEELFPSMMMLQSKADLEEERRLFYVAITRAEKQLTLSFAATRYRFGQLKSCEPSRFLLELDPRHLNMPRRNVVEEPIEARSSYSPPTSFKPKIKPAVQPLKSKSTYVPSADFKPSDTSRLVEGMKVEHLKFGFGTVTGMDTGGSDRKATIQFEREGPKTLLLSFAKLRIVE